MRLTALLVSMLMLAALSFGCGGAGGDPSFSPDPSVGDLFGDDDQGGGGEVEVPDDNYSDADAAEEDCFEDGFCNRRCTTALDCPPGFSCVMSMCTFDCVTDDECGTGGTCNDSGLCEAIGGDPIPECATDDECGEGRFCNTLGGCEKIPVFLGCRDDADCPAGQYCEDDHSCQIFPPAGIDCAYDYDCPGNYYCGPSYLCVQDCRTAYECGPAKTCSDDGRCVSVGAPSRLAYFTFNGLGSQADPATPAVFESASYKIDMVEIAPAARSEMLTSASFRLIGNGTTAVAAGTSDHISYQGQLADAAGQEIDGSVAVEVRLYDSLIAGIGQPVTNSHVIYADGHPAVEVDGGVFRIAIGDGAPLDPDAPVLPVDGLLEIENVYLELWIDGERLSPRQRLGAQPATFHARYARYADEVGNLPAITEENLPNYPADLITTGTISTLCVPTGLGVSIIDGQLSSDRVPDLSAGDFEQTGSIPVDMIGDMDAAKITSGTIPSHMLPEGEYIAREDFVVISGSVADDQMLVFPSGFDPATECEYILTPSVTMGSVEGIDQIYLGKSDVHVVNCEVDWHEASDGESHTVPCTANYMIICKR